MTIGEAARRDVVVCTRETTILDVARKMRTHGIGSVVVVEEKHPVGIITDRDLAVEVTAAAADPSQVHAGQIMTADPMTLEPDVSMANATRMMRDSGVRRVPLVQDGQLVGIVTMDDLIKTLAQELDDLAEIAAIESPAR